MKCVAMLSVWVLLIAGVSSIAIGQTSPAQSMVKNQLDMRSMDKTDKGNVKLHTGTGVVKSIDTAAGSITLAHDPIKSLNWPAMSMAFKVKDKSLLEKTKAGDKVQFTLVQSGKDYFVTSIK